jgi:uncharacterized protein (DUF58 family)
VLVHPSTDLADDRVLARMWEDPPVRPPVSKPWPTGFEFYGMRDYTPGDDLRRVVWSAVAKTGRMLVRESEQGITDRVSIILDTGDEVHSKGDPSETLELGIRIAASVAKKHVGDGFAVSLITNDGRQVSAARGANAATNVLDSLARVEASRSPLSAVGELLLTDARGGGHLIVVTPHIDNNMTKRLRLALERGASATIVKIVSEDSDPLSLSRVATLGCRVVQVPVGSPIRSAFAHQVGGGLRR